MWLDFFNAWSSSNNSMKDSSAILLFLCPLLFNFLFIILFIYFYNWFLSNKRNKNHYIQGYTPESSFQKWKQLFFSSFSLSYSVGPGYSIGSVLRMCSGLIRNESVFLAMFISYYPGPGRSSMGLRGSTGLPKRSRLISSFYIAALVLVRFNLSSKES